MMTRFFILMVLAAVCALSPAYADENEGYQDQAVEAKLRQVPIITFRQQVDCVTAMQQHPSVLQAKLDQSGDIINASLIIANDQNRAQAKKLASEFIHVIKRKTLDDDPDKKSLGKGLYTYKINVTRANKAVLATGIKRFDEAKIEWAINDEGEKNAAMSEGETPQ